MTQTKNTKTRTAFCTLGVALLCLLASGCSPTSTAAKTEGGEQAEEHHHHDHGHRPKSYVAALDQIKHARDEIKAAFDAGTPNECDNALHEVAEVLEALPEVAAETDLPKEDWQVVKDQSRHLFDQFMRIHDGFHGESSSEGTSFDSVADEINTSIETLESKIAATGEKVESSAGHDHAGLDHDGHDHSEQDHDGHEGHAH